MARLKRSTLFYYSLTDLPVMLSIFPAVVFLPKFYTSDMGVPLTVAATIMLVVRLFDLVSDPLMGYVSDRTHSRWGRRRPWIVLAVPLHDGRRLHAVPARRTGPVRCTCCCGWR